MRFSMRAIAEATGGTAHGPEHEGVVWTDTRTLPEGAWFVALRGPNFDAHDFLGAARDAGAAGAVLERPVPGWTGPWVEVADTTVALQDLGRAARDRLTGPVVGVAGSAGKTTTRALVACALRPLGVVHQTQANLNNHLGVPLTLLAADPGVGASVVELGTSGPGELALLADIARPDVRLIVNIGPEHLEGFGDLAGVAAEETALVHTARDGDVCLINADDPWLAPLALPGRTVRWGEAADADIRLVDVRIDGAAWSCTARFETPEGPLVVHLPTPAHHLAHNAGAALAAAWAAGVPLQAAAEAMAAYAPVGMRLAPIRWPDGITAINDAYNANPPSVRASLDTLRRMEGRRVAVLGDMLELGDFEAALHAEIVAHVDGLGLELVLLVGPRMVAAAGGPHASTLWSAVQGEELAGALADWLRPGDTVLFKGSRGARVERVLQAVETLRYGGGTH